MPDTLYQKLIILGSKIEDLNVKVEKLADKSSFSLLTPIIAALITAVVGTLLAQAIDRVYKNRRETKRDLREIHSKCVNLKIKLKDLFRQLAMHKFHAQYWWHLHSKESNKDFGNKYYLEHLRSQSEARMTEREIGEVKAAFLAEVVKYEKLKGRKFNVDIEKIAIEDLVFPKAKTYTDDISVGTLRKELAEGDERILRESFFSKLEIFQTIIDKMK